MLNSGVLSVEDAPVGDDDDGVEDRSAILLTPDQLVCQPSNGVGLAAYEGGCSCVMPVCVVPSQGWPQRAMQMRRSRPRSLVSVVIVISYDNTIDNCKLLSVLLASGS